MPLSSCVGVLVKRGSLCGAVWAHPSGDSHAPACEKTFVSLGGQQAELALVDEALEVLDLLLERGLLEVLCGVRVGGLAAGVCVGEGRHFEGLFVACRKGWN